MNRSRLGASFVLDDLLPRRVRPDVVAALRADPGLAALLDALRSASRLTPQGTVLLRRELSRALRVGAAAGGEVGASAGPGRTIDDPIVVTGLPRTGTTLLHHLLSEVDALRTLRFDEAFMGPERCRRDPVGAGNEAARYLAVLDRLSPRARRLHPMTADGPEECMTLQQATFASDRYAIMATLPPYQRWLDEASQVEPHRRFRRLLEQLPCHPDQTWALKCPTHARHLDDLVVAFPGVRLVLTHRDPAKVVPSFANLVKHIRSVAEEPDVEGIAAEWLPIWVEAMALTSRVRAGRPAGSVLDVHYPELLADPVALALSVCGAFAVETGPADVERMRAWLAAHPQLDASERAYRAEDFGLRPASIRAAFQDYMEEHRIAVDDD